MSFRANLRRGRSHLLLVVVMLVTAGIVVAIEDENLTRETGKAPPKRVLPITADDVRGRAAIPEERRKNPTEVVQIGAYDSARDAETAAKAFAARSDSAETRIDSFESGGRIVHRLVVVPREGTEAKQLCAALSGEGIDCFVRSR